MVLRNNTVAIIIQARMGSSRLPGKVLKDLCGKPMLVRIIDRLKQCRSVDDIIVATSQSSQNNKIIDCAKKSGVKGFVATCHENDVLERYIQAAKKHHVDVIVRITADCPLIDPALIDNMVKEFSKKNVDYLSNSLKSTFPRGLNVELFTTEALIRSSYFCLDIKDKEHVVIGLRSYPDLFKTENIEAEGKLHRPDLRLTVDSKEDFDVVKSIYHYFYDKIDSMTSTDVIDFLDSNPSIKKINSHIIQENKGGWD